MRIPPHDGALDLQSAIRAHLNYQWVISVFASWLGAVRAVTAEILLKTQVMCDKHCRQLCSDKPFFSFSFYPNMRFRDW